MGSAFYVAPEVLDGCYGCEADVWSAGVVLFIMLAGVPPFWGQSEAAMNKAIREAKLSFKARAWKKVSDDAIDLVRRMLTRDVKKRWTARQARGEHRGNHGVMCAVTCLRFMRVVAIDVLRLIS